MADGYALEKRVWTEEDFERMGWHDARVHAFAFLPETWEFALDIDYIFEWLDPGEVEARYSFWSAPATLVFENVTDLRIELEPYPDASIDGVERRDPGVPRNAAHIGKAKDWQWVLDFHQGQITFRSAGYALYVRRDALRNTTQSLSLEERGGVSFRRGWDREAAV